MRAAQLAHVLRVGAQDGDLADIELQLQHQAREDIGFCSPGEDMAVGLFEQLDSLVGIRAGRIAQPQVIKVEGALIGGGQRVGTLIEDGEPEVIDDRQGVGQGLGFGEVELQPHIGWILFLR